MFSWCRHMRSTKTRISLRIRAVWFASFLSAWRNHILGYPKCSAVKILIRLRERAGWSESSMGAHTEGTFSVVAAPIVLMNKVSYLEKMRMKYPWLYSQKYLSSPRLFQRSLICWIFLAVVVPCLYLYWR